MSICSNANPPYDQRMVVCASWWCRGSNSATVQGLGVVRVQHGLEGGAVGVQDGYVDYGCAMHQLNVFA